MADRIILYWRDIPTQVIVKAGRKSAKRELPERFIQAVDRCAMKSGARDTDSYLAEWRRGAPDPCGDDLEQEATEALARLESAYGPDRLRELVENGGWESR
ncbi:virulence factor [Faunimonas sp. B44]|uniref:virulence factor n=1 Tax=Faunimonas sp. B44 TaxID=3461493 RepID=UPI004044834C